jgi:YD repeat-containing protein
VNTFTGELFELESVDLNLGGPMPLVFERYYGSMITSDGNLTSALGRNRLHNFDAKLTVAEPNATVILSDGRAVQFTKAGTKWMLAMRKDIAFQLVQSGTKFTLADPRSQLMWTFDSTSGQLTKIADGRGNEHTLHYTGAQLTSVTDGLSRTLAFAYDVNGKLANVRDTKADAPDPAVREVNFTYSGNDLATATDALSHTTTFSYDGNGNLLSKQFPRTNSPYSQTYTSGRVATQTEHPTVGVTQVTNLAYNTGTHTTTITDPVAARAHQYTPTGELKELTDEAGKRIAFTSDAVGLRNTVTDQLGRTVTITYHVASGKPASITAEDGTVTTFTYEARAVSEITFYDLVKVIYPDGSSRSFTYDAKGNLTSSVDQIGKQTKFTYNTHGQILTATDATGGVTTFTYDAAGNLATSKDSDTSETAYTFDAFSRLTRVTLPAVPPLAAAQLDVSYDDADRIASFTDENGNQFGITYDENDNIKVVSDPTTAATQIDYDLLDRIVSVTDRLSKSSSVAYDTRDLLAKTTDELSHATAIAYDSRQRVASVTEQGGATTSFGYDDTGRLLSVTDPLTHTSSLTRNARGSVIAASDALGHTVRVERDNLQRITKIIDAIGRQTGLGYDRRGLLASASRDGVGAGTYTRDAAGRLVKIVDPNHGAWSYAYTSAGRLSSTKDPLGKTTDFAYDPRGQLQTITLPEGGTCAIRARQGGTNHAAQLQRHPRQSRTRPALRL